MKKVIVFMLMLLFLPLVFANPFQDFINSFTGAGSIFGHGNYCLEGHETDLGQEYDSRGTVPYFDSNGITGTKNDVCLVNGQLREFACFDSTVMYWDVWCDNGCSDGACISDYAVGNTCPDGYIDMGDPIGCITQGDSDDSSGQSCVLSSDCGIDYNCEYFQCVKKENTVICDDPDGDSVITKSTFYYQNKEYTDYCVTETTMKEWVCDWFTMPNEPYARTITCPENTKCEGGVCKTITYEESLTEVYCGYLSTVTDYYVCGKRFGDCPTNSIEYGSMSDCEDYMNSYNGQYVDDEGWQGGDTSDVVLSLWDRIKLEGLMGIFTYIGDLFDTLAGLLKTISIIALLIIGWKFFSPYIKKLISMIRKFLPF